MAFINEILGVNKLGETPILSLREFLNRFDGIRGRLDVRGNDKQGDLSARSLQEKFNKLDQGPIGQLRECLKKHQNSADEALFLQDLRAIRCEKEESALLTFMFNEAWDQASPNQIREAFIQQFLTENPQTPSQAVIQNPSKIGHAVRKEVLGPEHANPGWAYDTIVSIMFGFIAILTSFYNYLKFPFAGPTKNNEGLVQEYFNKKMNELKPILFPEFAKNQKLFIYVFAQSIQDGDKTLLEFIISNGLIKQHSKNPDLLQIVTSLAKDDKYFNILSKIIENCPDLKDTANKHGTSILSLALSYKANKIVKFLIEQKASINSADEYGMSPLHYAVLHNDVEMTRLLLQNGAKVDHVDKKQNTAFHLIAKLHLKAHGSYKSKNFYEEMKGALAEYASVENFNARQDSQGVSCQALFDITESKKQKGSSQPVKIQYQINQLSTQDQSLHDIIKSNKVIRSEVFFEPLKILAHKDKVFHNIYTITESHKKLLKIEQLSLKISQGIFTTIFNLKKSAANRVGFASFVEEPNDLVKNLILNLLIEAINTEFSRNFNEGYVEALKTALTLPNVDHRYFCITNLYLYCIKSFPKTPAAELNTELLDYIIEHAKRESKIESRKKDSKDLLSQLYNFKCKVLASKGCFVEALEAVECAIRYAEKEDILGQAYCYKASCLMRLEDPKKQVECMKDINKILKAKQMIEVYVKSVCIIFCNTCILIDFMRTYFGQAAMR